MLLGVAPLHGAAARPNFIVLISDDVGYDDLGCYGSLCSRTPNIAALAAGGRCFNQAYPLASSCSPSRSSIISGRYPHNPGEAAELHRPISGHLPSIAGLLRGAGYHTALAGKNHLSWTPVPAGPAVPTAAFAQIYEAKTAGNSGGHGNWLKALEECPAGSPFFLWLASLDAHRDWDGDREWDAALYGPKHDPQTVILPPALLDSPETRADFASYLNAITRYDHFGGKVIAELNPTALIRPLAFSEHNWHDYEAHGRSVRDGRYMLLRNFRPQLALQGPADSVRSPSFQALRAAREKPEPLPPIQQDVFLAPRPEVELYDTRADPHQISNLAGRPEFDAVQKRLLSALEKWMEQTGDSVPAEISPDMFNRASGAALGARRNQAYRPPPGADRGADRNNADGLAGR